MFCLLNEPEKTFIYEKAVLYFIAFQREHMQRLVKPVFTFICSDTVTMWVREGQRPCQEGPLSHTNTHTQYHTTDEYTSVEIRMVWHKGAPPPLTWGIMT